MKTYTVDKLLVNLADSRDEMGEKAGKDIAAKIRELLAKKEEINIIFAAAPSQNETLATLINETGIDWSRINAFHMDEYVGLANDDPRGFGNFLNACLFSKVPFKSVHYIRDAGSSADEICKNYTELLKQYPTDIVCMGIGENGHIAFNDPPVADFCDKLMIKKVALDEICRNQQVNDGCFATIDEVPKYALTLTVPTLFNAGYLFCSVPAPTKAKAVKSMLNDEINEKCPATILRRHDNAILYCDNDSAALL